MKSEMFRELYFFEMERKDNMVNRVGIPITILSLITAAYAYFLDNLEMIIEKMGILRGTFGVCWGLSLLAYLGSIYLIIRTLIGHKYGYIQTSNEIKDDKNNINKYFESLPQSDYSNDIEALQENFMIEYYSKPYDHNSNLNNIRGKYIHDALIYIVISFIFLVMSFIPFSLLKKDFKDVKEMKINNIKEIDNTALLITNYQKIIENQNEIIKILSQKKREAK